MVSGSFFSYENKGVGHGIMFKWCVVANKALEFLNLILPYLRGKTKLEAQLAIQFQTLKSYTRPLSLEERKWRDMHYILLRILKKRVSVEKVIESCKLKDF